MFSWWFSLTSWLWSLPSHRFLKCSFLLYKWVGFLFALTQVSLFLHSNRASFFSLWEFLNMSSQTYRLFCEWPFSLIHYLFLNLLHHFLKSEGCASTREVSFAGFCNSFFLFFTRLILFIKCLIRFFRFYINCVLKYLIFKRQGSLMSSHDSIKV